MRRLIPILAMLLPLVGCAYGPRQDHSRFISAKLLDNGQVLFSFQELVYRPAAGIAAFPDGGIPRYEKDQNALGMLDPASGKLRLFLKERNRHWTNGQGTLFVMLSCGRTALISQSGQTRSLASTDLRHWLLDVDSGRLTPLSLKEDFARVGRDTGEIYLVAEDGTLVFINVSVEDATRGERVRRGDAQPQIWVRRPDGKLMKVADGPHYEGYAAGEIIYWVADTRQFMAYRVGDGVTRRLNGYRHPEFRDITRGASISTDGRALQLGRKEGDLWHYELLPVTIEEVRHQL